MQSIYSRNAFFNTKYIFTTFLKFRFSLKTTRSENYRLKLSVSFIDFTEFYRKLFIRQKVYQSQNKTSLKYSVWWRIFFALSMIKALQESSVAMK